MEHFELVKNPDKLNSRVQESYKSVGHFLNNVEESALLFDALCMDCPIVGASPGFCRLTGYTLDEALGRNCRLMLQGLPQSAVSKSGRKNIQDFTTMCRTKGLINIAEVSCIEANSRKDGSHFVSLFVLGLCKIEKFIFIVGVQMFMGEGLSARVSQLEDKLENSRKVFKGVRKKLMEGYHRQANSHSMERITTLDSLPDLALRRQFSGQPEFAFYARRLQDRCLLINTAYTAIRREPDQIANNCLVFGDRPMKHTAEGLSFYLQVDEVVSQFTGLPSLGFTKRRPRDVHDLYPGVARCCGSSVLIGACGEAFARDHEDHFVIKFKQPPPEEVQQWSLDPSLPAHMRRAPVAVERGDVLACHYLRNGHMKFEVNGKTVLDFDMQRPIDVDADYYAVVDVSFAAYSLTLLASLATGAPSVASVVEQISEQSALTEEENADEVFNRDVSFYSADHYALPEPLSPTNSFSKPSEDPPPHDVSAKVNNILVKQSIRDAVKACNFMVTIADPRDNDCPLIAVSKEFTDLTGFESSDIIGINCRFLNHGCDMNPIDLMNLRRCSKTGEPFTAILENRKKNGDLFLNLLDLRGLTVATNPETGEPLWFLVGVQADVTDVADGEIPEDHWSELQAVSNAIRSSIASEIAKMAVDAASAGPHLDSRNSPKASLKTEEWNLLTTPVWMAGTPLGERKPGDMAKEAVAGKQRDEAQTEEQKDLVSGKLDSSGLRYNNSLLLGISMGAVILGAAWLARRR